MLMALINCSECGKEISDKAVACPNCGAPISASKKIVSDNQTTYYMPKETKGFGGGRMVTSAKKKIRTGCLVFFMLFIGAMVFSIIQRANNPDAYLSTNKTTDTSKNDDKKSLLELDETSWEQFKNLYISHNNFMSIIDAFSNDKITALDFYNECQNAEKYFQEVSTTFNYGTNDDEITYLNVFETVALSDQSAASYLKKYIDTGKTSHLSKAQESIQRAKDAVVLIAENRGKLLVKAGLSDEEIQKKVEEDMEELESESSK